MAESISRMWELARGFQPARVLLSGVELGIFDALAEGPQTSEQVACSIGTDPRATDRLMNALCALELLSKEAGQFSNAPDSAELLVRGRPGSLAEAMMHTVHLWDTWSTLSGCVKAGTAVLEKDPAARREWVPSFIAAMEALAVRRAPLIVKLLDLRGVKQILDVGGGSGAYAVAFRHALPQSHVTVFDLPDVIPLTQHYVTTAGITEGVECVPGNFLQQELGTGFDLVFISAIIHSNSPDENRLLLTKARQALRAGGQLVIQDFIMSEDRLRPPFGAFFSLNMLTGTPSGDTYTEKEVRDWMTSAGFTAVNRTDTPDYWTTLICGRTS